MLKNLRDLLEEAVERSSTEDLYLKIVETISSAASKVIEYSKFNSTCPAKKKI